MEIEPKVLRSKSSYAKSLQKNIVSYLFRQIAIRKETKNQWEPWTTNIKIFRHALLKLMFSEKASKFDEICLLADFFKFYGLLRIYEL